MRSALLVRLALVTIVAFTATVWTGCNHTNTGGTAPAANGGGKVPITTKSEDARKEYLQGRDLSERLLANDSLQHFDKAIALDPDFAAAELARANNSPTAKEFFEHLDKAVMLAEKVSDGERLFILANQAGANGQVAIQKDDLDKLVAAYPNDERAQFALGNYYFGQKNTALPSSITRKRQNSLPTIHLPTTFLAMPIVSRRTMPTPSRPSRNIRN